MKRFFDFSPELLQYFTRVDERFSQSVCLPRQALGKSIGSADFSGIRAVVWDIYGTLCSRQAGDLEQSLSQADLLTQAAAQTIREFHLEEFLHKLDPSAEPAITLRGLYLHLIEQSHRVSAERGVEYPEVIIENLWMEIIRYLVQCGWSLPPDESLHSIAWKWAYFFDAALQPTRLYPGAADTLHAIRQDNILQGIISNAQFYTPLHLRRLLRAELQRPRLELDDIFDASLVFFSYELGCSKPNLIAFRRAQEYLAGKGIAPGEIVYIGNDMLNDIYSAACCGWKSILFAGDKSQTVLREDEPRCQNLEPDATCSSLSQIANLLIQNKNSNCE